MYKDKHYISYCEMCECKIYKCGMCGMNTCSGGYGTLTDGNGHKIKCPACPSAYEKAKELVNVQGS